MCQSGTSGGEPKKSNIKTAGVNPCPTTNYIFNKNGTANRHVPYTGDYLSSLSFSSSSHSNVYTFKNNAFGNPKYTYINGKMLSNNIYNVKTGQIASIEYGNNFSKKFTYNNLGLQTNLSLGVPGSESNVFRWKYDSKGTLLNHTDFILDTQYNYTYDAIGRLIRETHLDSNDLTVQKGYVAYSYDIRNNLTKLNLNYGGRSWSNKYSYSAIDGRDETASYAKDNLPTRFTMTNSQYADYYYDNLNRITKRVFIFGSGENAKIVNQYSYNLSENYNGTEDGVTHRGKDKGGKDKGRFCVLTKLMFCNIIFKGENYAKASKKKEQNRYLPRNAQRN